MNYEDEPYVRKYTRMTHTRKRVRWQGRMLLDAMLDHFDRAGVFEFDGGDLAEAIELMTDIPREHVEPGLQRILESGTWILRGRFLVWPNYLEAQTCKRSDAARQRDSRERRRAIAHAEDVLGADAPRLAVTERDDPSRPVTEEPSGVTNGHVQSRDVTLSLAEPNRAEVTTTAGAREPSGPRGRLAERLVERPRSGGKPPRRVDELHERVPFGAWFPSSAWLEWFKASGLTDDEVDRTLSELRDAVTGRHDFEWLDDTALKFFESAISRKQNPRAGRRHGAPHRPPDHGVDPFAEFEEASDG